MLGYWTLGSGTHRIVVLNDWMGDTTAWEPALRYLDLQRFTWSFVDLRGYGRSRDLAGPYNLEQACADIVELQDHLGWGPVSLISHSMSCLVALRLAQQKQRVRQLVLVTPPPPGGFDADEEALESMRAIAFGSDAARSVRLQQRWGNRLSVGWTRFKTDHWRATSAPDAVAAYSEMFGVQGIGSSQNPVNIPVLAITGEEDAEIMRAISVRELLTPICPNLHITSFLQCGHYPMQEMPPLFVATIERFFADHR